MPRKSTGWTMLSGEALAISWLEKQTTPPRKLADIVQQYRDLTFFVDMTNEQRYADAQDEVWDRLLAAADHYAQRLRAKQAFHEGQLWPARCDRAIREWRDSQ